MVESVSYSSDRVSPKPMAGMRMVSPRLHSRETVRMPVKGRQYCAAWSGAKSAKTK